MKLGKIIIENNNLLTLQKGRPYFFPNCKNQDLINKTNLQYKVISPTRVYPRSKTDRKIALNYYDMMKLSVKRTVDIKKIIKRSSCHQIRIFKIIFKTQWKII